MTQTPREAAEAMRGMAKVRARELYGRLLGEILSGIHDIPLPAPSEPTDEGQEALNFAALEALSDKAWTERDLDVVFKAYPALLTKAREADALCALLAEALTTLSASEGDVFHRLRHKIREALQ